MGFWTRIFGRHRGGERVGGLRVKAELFRDLVERNNLVLELIADAGEKLGGEYIFDIQYLRALARQLAETVRGVISDVSDMTGNRYPELVRTLTTVEEEIDALLESRVLVRETDLVLRLDEIDGTAADAAGDKMGRLGEVRRQLGCNVPDGFVVSTYACHRVLEEAGLGREIDAWHERAASGPSQEFERQAHDLRQRIVAARLPGDLGQAIRREVERLVKRGGHRELAVRSSALDEDGASSFAGQYRTLLGVTPDRVPDAVKEVLASLFTPEVARYREQSGHAPARGAMAVGCLGMVEARASGVVYTLDPAQPGQETLLVTAAPGLGKTVVEGSGGVDRFEVSRNAPHPVLARSIGEKPWRYVAGRGRGLTREPVEASRQDAPSVTESELAELCAVALRIEKYMKCAQDIEWAVDAGGRIVILQVRPLRISEAAVPDDLDLSGIEIRHRILLRKRGVVACRGIGAGRVHIVAEEAPLDSIPEDVVLVARTPSPRLAGAVATARAVITDIGSATGHLAAVAREFRVPTIVETGGATQELAGAGEVTVDAESNLVYEGLVPELLRYQLLRRSSYEDTREFILLRKMLAKIAPLNLRDPQSPDFSPARCRTYHDIIRLAHEIAVNELVQGFRISPARSAAARPLTLDIPLDLVIVDLGGGMRGGLAAVPATLDDLRSIPLCALLDGLTAEGVWGTAPAAMDLNGFMSSATRSAVLTGPLVDAPQQNLAIVSERYLNLNLKLGYHFNIVECHASENRDDNFIYFRFGGGVTEMARRSRRADLLKRILRRFDFVVEGRQDLVIGRAKKMSLDDALERMRMIGRLIGFTRQLDIFLRDDAIVEHLVEDFIHGRIDATGR